MELDENIYIYNSHYYLRQRLAWVVVAKLEVHYNGKWKMQEGESSTKLDLLLPLFGRYCIGHLR